MPHPDQRLGDWSAHSLLEHLEIHQDFIPPKLKAEHVY